MKREKGQERGEGKKGEEGRSRREGPQVKSEVVRELINKQ